MRRTPLLALLIFLCVPVAAQTLRIIPIGQLDSAAMRQMPPMHCGPYFTFSPTDAVGGGMVYFGVATEPVTQVIAVPVGSIQARVCESCQEPQVDITGTGTSIRVEMQLSKQQWKMSPCLRHANLKGP